MSQHFNLDTIHQANDFRIYYNNKESMDQTVDEIFREEPYAFDTQTPTPVVIDAGSNIGIATLYFKTKHPHAKILCFEPDPNAFMMLKDNVAINHLEDVTLVHAALSKSNGMINFFGQIHDDEPDARGNSIIESWGKQRIISNVLQVQSVTLSSYIDGPVDFLKMDIEGAEQQVLEELGNKLSFVRQLAMEVHESDDIKKTNSLEQIVTLLKDNGFSVQSTEKSLTGVLPEATKAWAQTTNPRLFELKAIRL